MITDVSLVRIYCLDQNASRDFYLDAAAARRYGFGAVMRDNSGNWLVLVEPTDFTPDA